MTILQQLMHELEAAQKGGGASYKAGLSGSSPVAPNYHGPAGLFGVSGLERDVISTRVSPYGLASKLPAIGTNVTNPLYAYITSYAAPTGSNPVGVCDDPKVAGPVSTCFQTAQFGRYSFGTRTLDVDSIGLQTNRGEFLDLRVVNDPLLNTNAQGITTPQVGGNPVLTNEVLLRFVEVGVAFQNQLSQMVWTGNPANNTSGGGYREFPGLDILIGTGKVDALTGTSCPSLNSDIKDFNYARLDSGSNASTLVNAMSYLMRYLRYNAEAMNLNPATWSIVMRPELFWEVTAAWPCAYMTYRCQNTSAGTPLVIDATAQLQMRDDMRQNEYLMIDGIRYEVILDTGMHEDTNTTNNKVTSGCFASDIYVVPRTFAGGMVATYWEYKDYTQTAMIGIEAGRQADSFWTDGGRYLWHKQPPTNWCVNWIAKIEPRLILRVPQLAGRLTNIQYCPLQHIREPYTTDPYFVGGGVGARTAPSLFHEWTGN